MKKLLALLLCSVIVVSSVPMNSYAAISEAATKDDSIMEEKKLLEAAAGVSYDIVPISIKEEAPKGTTKEPTNEALESAIKAVKAKIEIPKEYSEFNYYFYNTNSYADSYWNLTWSNPKDYSSIQVNCDQNNHITHYSKYDYNQKISAIPTYLKSELKSTAENFIKKIAPEIASKIIFVDATYEGIYSGNYGYNFIRKQNKVNFPDNTVTVWVNSVTGEVSSASIHWLYDETVPSSSVKLTKEEATKLIKENMTMNLVYRTDYYRIYEGDKYVKKAYLVYEPSVKYISIDAKTKEVYLTREEWIERSTNQELEKAMDEAKGDTGSGAYILTPEELSKIEDLKNLISKEKAIKAVTGNKYLYLDKNANTYTATLNKSYSQNGEDSYVWNVELSDKRAFDYEKETDYYRAYASAQVDAKTGKILSYYASLKNYYDEKNEKWNTVKIPYGKEEGQKILEKFLAIQNQSRFNKTILTDQTDDYIAYYKKDVPVYGGYNYKYNRVNEGVEYSYNGIYGSVDGVTGKIYSYYSNWDENVTFESPVGAMTPEEALEHYLSKDGFELKYEINVINNYDPGYQIQKEYIDFTEALSVDYQIRLVYRPDINPIFISPFTGEQLNYNGEVYKVTKPYDYIDIENTAENREILLLADMNVGFEGGFFSPKKEITTEEFTSLFEKVGYGYGYAMEEAKVADKLITREELAQFFIVKLGLEKIANLQGIYQTGYSDEFVINENYLGAVALAKGLGLIEEDKNNHFSPTKKITRAEAVHYILKFVEVQRAGVLW